MKVLVSAPPPTANGDLHVGHLSGPFLRADILQRFCKMQGREVYCICGADEHQSYVAYRAAQLGQTAQQAVDKFSEAIRETLEAAHIDVDLYMRPSRSPDHQKLTQEVFAALYATGKLIAREKPCLYCNHCERYLFEVYVVGKCPHCGAGSCGNACEACGRPNQCVDLKDAVCNQCGQTPATRLSTRLYFPLGEYEEKLRSYYESAVLSPRLREICEGMLKDGLPEIVMCHPADWGIPVPVPGFEGQRIYVWFEVATGLLSASKQLSEKLDLAGGWKEFWAKAQADVVQFCGFDNGYFYGMLIPAILMAYDPDIVLPKGILLNEFYRLDGSKFSTSRNHAIWGRELIGMASLDAVRFYLALSGPETEQTNFTLDEFDETVRRELISGWQEWLQDLGTRLSSDYDNVAPAVDVWNDEQRRFQEKIEGYISEAAAAYNLAGFSPRQAARVLTALVQATREFGETMRRGTEESEVLQTTTALELLAVNTLAMLAAPIMPEFSAQLFQALGNDESAKAPAWSNEMKFVAAGTVLDLEGRTYFSPVVMNQSARSSVAS
ncbi:MAG TPA: methionine--tRNA ligase [Pyrinomonadaceae bacterium]